MSDIKIRRLHDMPHNVARGAAEKMAKRLQKDFELDYEWDGDVLVFERPGVNGELTVAPDYVEMEVKLGFLLRMMKPTIEKHIHEDLDEIFAAHAKASPRPKPRGAADATPKVAPKAAPKAKPKKST